jgi:eukaryotic-like serine/threonine-protein kinase
MSAGENEPVSASVSAGVSVGDVVAGKYHVERVLGAGGMGIVVAATHVQLDRKVAIKFLLPAALANPDIVARFSREARAASKIESEHVARVIDVGVLESGAPFMVMEHLEGRDLAARVAEQGVLSVEEMARYVLQACEALAEAHAAGIVHRDLKPANLFLAQRADRSTSVKVLDFGISKAPVGSGGTTNTQAIMGSPHYMSPEQLMSSKHVDHRSDVWSLGIVMYEALTGSPPFLGEQMPEIVAKILQAPTPRVSDTRPEVPPEVDAIITKCTAKNAADRYSSVAHLARALAPFAPDSARSVDRISRVLNATEPPPASPPISTAAAPTPAGATSNDAPSGTTGWGATQAAIPRRKMSPLIFVLGGAAILFTAGIFAVARFSKSSAVAAPPQATTDPVALPPIPPIPSMVLAPPTDLPATPALTAVATAIAPPVASTPKIKSPTSHASAHASAAPAPTAPSDPLHMGIK